MDETIRTATIVFGIELTLFDWDGSPMDTGVISYQLSCGHEIAAMSWDEPHYCTECGARIIKE